MKGVDVIIPWRDTSEHRARAFAHVCAHLRRALPEAGLIVADSGDDKFNRAASFNRGVEQSEARIIVLHAADCVVPEEQLWKAIMLANIEHGLCFAFDGMRYLSQQETEAFYRGDELSIGPNALTSAGAVACTRETYDRAGGHDERFVEWGGEDSAFLVACETLVGLPRCVPGLMLHLWHPPDGPSHPEVHKEAALRDESGWQALMHQYIAARGQPDAMRALTEHRL